MARRHALRATRSRPRRPSWPPRARRRALGSCPRARSGSVRSARSAPCPHASASSCVGRCASTALAPCRPDGRAQPASVFSVRTTIRRRLQPGGTPRAGIKAADGHVQRGSSTFRCADARAADHDGRRARAARCACRRRRARPGAPGDGGARHPVLWTVLVPSEQAAGTERVELAIPAGVLPFSFEDAPAGRGRASRPRRLAALRRLARAHPRRRPGHLPLPGLDARARGPRGVEAIQTYRDGAVVRWIGSPRAEYPASVTTISRAAPRENAGGEGAAAGGGSPVAGAGAAPAGTSGGGGTAARTGWPAALRSRRCSRQAASASPRRSPVPVTCGISEFSVARRRAGR